MLLIMWVSQNPFFFNRGRYIIFEKKKKKKEQSGNRFPCEFSSETDVSHFCHFMGRKSKLV